MRKALLLLLLMVAPLLAAADEEPQLLMHLEKEPAPGSSTTIITREQIDRSHYVFVLDLLRSAAGLQVLLGASAGNPGFVLSRGSAQEQVLVLIDHTAVNATSPSVDLANLTTTNVERIEITRGPQSALYGSSALGAVINIITRYSGPWVSGIGEYGSDNMIRGGIRSGAGSNANHYSVAYEHFETDGPQENLDYRNDTISARAKVMITPWTAVGFTYHDIFTESETTLNVAPLSVNRDTRHQLLSVPVSQQIANWLTAEFRFSTYKQEFDSHISLFDSDSARFDSDSRTDTYRIGGRLRLADIHELFAGYEREETRTNTFRVSDSEIQNDAIFVEYRLNTPKFRGALALRNDDDNISDAHFSPFLSAAYRLNDHVQFIGSAGTAFRRPEQSFFQQKQEVTGFSAGFNITPSESSQINATFFSNQYESSRFLGTSAERVLSYDATGIEIEGSSHLLEQLQVRGNFTYTSTDEDSIVNHSGFLGLAYTHKDFQADMNWFYTGNTERVGAFHRADLIASYNLPRGFQVFGKILNLFDHTDNRSGFFLPQDRAFYFGVRYQ